ncbi:MAG: hypothetical protein JNN00_00410 [Chitinophagaceae bacterium]|nr:hypothetical protein [Chitinophagaceae bacterium]
MSLFFAKLVGAASADHDIHQSKWCNQKKTTVSLSFTDYTSPLGEYIPPYEYPILPFEEKKGQHALYAACSGRKTKKTAGKRANPAGTEYFNFVAADQRVFPFWSFTENLNH